ncbi:putative mycofactocin system creatinine amidohydrolase family protein MftE [subsurface metagenome]
MAVLGIGSFEQHSHHLPLETDFLFAVRISREVTEILRAVYLNPLPYSTSLEHRGFAGTISLSPETLKRMIWDIAASAADWGIRYLALINSHGGNFILNPTVREWNMDRRLPHIMLIDFFLGLTDVFPNLHAGEVETSMMLFLSPEKVKPDKAVDFVPQLGREDLTHFGMKKLSPRGGWGYPTRATPEKGGKWYQESIDYCVERIKTLRSFFETADPAAEP